MAEKTIDELAEDFCDYVDSIAVPAEHLHKSVIKYGEFLTRGQKAAWARKYNLFRAACERHNVDPIRYMDNFTKP